MRRMADDPLIPVIPELTRRLGCSRRLWAAEVARGAIASTKIHGRAYSRRSIIEAYIAEKLRPLDEVAA